MNFVWMSTEAAILTGAFFATIGWLYTARRGRTLAKKQHTISVMMQANFSESFLADRVSISPYVKGKKLPRSVNEVLHASLRRVLNHYEFVAAGLRNGDLDERLVKDSERGTFVAVYENLNEHIYGLRTKRDREGIYEHLEWLYLRWEKEPPGLLQKAWETLKGTPYYGKRRSDKK